MIYGPNEFLNDWQEHWGVLDDKWIEKFLSHDSIPEILTYDRTVILNAIRKSRKLFRIAKYLESKNRVSGRAQLRKHNDSMQQAADASFKNSLYDPKLPSDDWWRDQE